MNKSHSNPYIDDNGKPKLLRSVICFVDILGYKELMYSKNSADERQELLDDLYNTFEKTRGHFDSKNTLEFEFSAFSDNILIAIPLINNIDINQAISRVVYAVSFYQMEMVMKGYFIRGAIAIGELFMNDIFIFGHGLIEAHTAETKLALNPRIVLEKNTKVFVDDYPRTCRDNDFLKDYDGEYFVHYLSTLNHDVTNKLHHPCELAKHKKAIEAKLAACKDSHVRLKYLWAAKYHNYFCEQNQDINKEMKINTPDIDKI